MQSGLLRRLPDWLDIQKLALAKCSDEKYQYVLQHGFLASLIINAYNFNTKFLESSGIWCNVSIMFYDFILPTNSSFEPQHYLEDSYMPIFALI